MRYLTETRDRIYVKGYGFLSFAKNRALVIGKSFLILQRLPVTLPERGLSKKRQKHQVIWFEIRLQRRLQGFLKGSSFFERIQLFVQGNIQHTPRKQQQFINEL